MPRTKFAEMVAMQQKAKPNYLHAYFVAGKKALKLTDEDIAKALNVDRVTVCKKLNRTPEKWTVAEIIQFCGVLGLDPVEAFSQAIQ